jgi:hypothetical protein
MQHPLNIQHSKGDKLMKSILITGLLLCLAVSTLHGKGHALGYKHTDLLKVLTNYADLLRKMSRGGEAARLEARVAEIRAKANPKMSN